MRFLITCWPFPGHLHPQMAVAKALLERGHDVAFYTGRSAADVVEGQGFPLFPMRLVDEDRAYRCVRALETGARGSRVSPRLLRRTFRQWLVDTIPDQVSDLQAVMSLWSPDVLVTDLSLWAPIVVLWEATPVPVALSSTFLGPLLPGRDAPPWGLGLRPPRSGTGRLMARAVTELIDFAGKSLRQEVDDVRAHHGLEPLGMSVNAFSGKLPLYLVPSLPELDYHRSDLPPTVHYVGPVGWHPPASAAEREWLAAVPRDTPWVHVTESTLRYGDPFLLRAAVTGLADLRVQVVATTGAHRDPADLGLEPLPANVHLRRWVSHADLLPRCSVFVTTGGPATIVAGLQAGVPVVVVPTTWDKPDNARRVVEAGVGVRLRAARCTADRLRAAVQSILDDPGYALRARALAVRLAAAPGPAGAAALLENLADRRATA